MRFLSSEAEKENLQSIVGMLNDKRGDEMLLEAWMGYSPSDADRLRRIVIAWQRARAEDPHLLTKKMKLTPQDRMGLEEFNKKTSLATLLDGTLQINFPNASPAFLLFTHLLGSSPHTQDLLGGPCKACEEWYIRKTARPSIYCSRACSINGQKAKERQAQRHKLLTDIETAARNYESLSDGSRYRKMGWRKYVMDATGTSQKFLTQIIKNGEITPPKGV
jgi:hypothetical protein